MPFQNSASLYITENNWRKITAHWYITKAGWKCTSKYCKTLCKCWHFLSMFEVFPLIKSLLTMQLPCYSLVYLLCFLILDHMHSQMWCMIIFTGWGDKGFNDKNFKIYLKPHGVKRLKIVVLDCWKSKSHKCQNHTCEYSHSNSYRVYINSPSCICTTYKHSLIWTQLSSALTLQQSGCMDTHSYA
jgi:hypothetical protein